MSDFASLYPGADYLKSLLGNTPQLAMPQARTPLQAPQQLQYLGFGMAAAGGEPGATGLSAFGQGGREMLEGEESESARAITATDAANRAALAEHDARMERARMLYGADTGKLKFLSQTDYQDRQLEALTDERDFGRRLQLGRFFADRQDASSAERYRRASLAGQEQDRSLRRADLNDTRAYRDRSLGLQEERLSADAEQHDTTLRDRQAERDRAHLLEVKDRARKAVDDWRRTAVTAGQEPASDEIADQYDRFLRYYGGESMGEPPPMDAIEYLTNNPHTAAYFDAEYGYGMSQRYLTRGAG